MQRAMRGLVAILGLLAIAPQRAAADESVAAVQKVIQMLGDMEATAKQEKADEIIAFAEFKTWCAEESANLKGAIKKSGEMIETLSADIDKKAEEAAALGKAIEGLDSDVATMEGQIKSATAKRAKDNAARQEEIDDFAESVDALERAITFLQEQDYDRKGAASLLQLVEQGRIPSKAKALIQTFRDMISEGKQDPGNMGYDAPEANAYEFQSGGIISMLKKLRDDFREKLGESQKEEMNAKHAYQMVVQDLRDSIDNANRDVEEKSTEKSRKEQSIALDKKERSATEHIKREDEDTLKSMTVECSEKRFSFDEKQQLRQEEIEAIGQAIDILKSGDVSGNAEKHLDLAQLKTVGSAFVQIGESDGAASASGNKHIRHKIAAFLTAEGERLHSNGLAMLASKLEADPFAKVKKLIDDLITRLLEEANADAEHEGYCDTEMGKSKVTRTKLSEDIASLTASIDDGKAKIMTLTQDIATLGKEIDALEVAMGEAMVLRKKESQKNAATVKDAKAAQVAVTAATAVLKDFYAKAAKATAFTQSEGPNSRMALLGTRKGIKMGSEEWQALANPNFQGKVDVVNSNLQGTVDKGHKEGMQTFGATYKGQQDEAGGVLGMLEVILSDFATLQADTEAAEAASQKAYDEFVIESKRSKATKSKSMDMNNQDKADAEAKLQQDIAELKSTQDQLIAADAYHERLVPQCIDKGMTYDEKVAAREAEITSLKEALQLLSSEDIATSAF